MKKYLYDYIKETDKKLENKNTDINDLIKVHLEKIKFFQHERLIHLLVTLFYAIFMMIFLVFSFIHYIFIIIFFIITIFLIFYVVHYFRLENGVQYLYKQYDIMMKKVK
ncbi:MAG: hypothetical protein IK997_02730 [Bacilli bacterium]|nr:hypothetical protein [Bacilli bacterium]